MCTLTIIQHIMILPVCGTNVLARLNNQHTRAVAKRRLLGSAPNWTMQRQQTYPKRWGSVVLTRSRNGLLLCMSTNNTVVTTWDSSDADAVVATVPRAVVNGTVKCCGSHQQLGQPRLRHQCGPREHRCTQRIFCQKR